MPKAFSIDCSTWSYDEIMMFCGTHDKNLDLLRSAFDAELIFNNGQLDVQCDNREVLDCIEKIVRAAYTLIHEQKHLNASDLNYLIRLVKASPSINLERLNSEPIAKTVSGKLIYPKTIGQRILIDALTHDDIIFATGVAGTGKTYLAVVYAVAQLKKGNFSRIVLTRPAVEAGENLGFLPGDLKEKVDPYLRPLYDALYDMLGVETVEKLLEKEVIEIAPLAYMRGRTLDNAFIILDEAQNTTKNQMKMFLTRMGFNSKVVITGDGTQIDLVKKQDSGLLHARKILQGVDKIGFVELSGLDVVRNPLVQKIIECYERAEGNE